tara:strand:+ start:821 stop:1036 length:216 start_codon:yes stop_codon:yes gene_type:complete
MNNNLNQIKNTHPNTYMMWKKYVDLKYNAYIQSLKQCDDLIKTINEHDLPDLTKDNLLFLILFSNNINEGV